MVPHSRFYREPWIQNLLVWKSSDMNFLINCEILIKDDSENTLKYLLKCSGVSSSWEELRKGALNHKLKKMSTPSIKKFQALISFRITSNIKK